MGNELLDKIKLNFELEGEDINKYSPLTLAFLGDCVYDLIIRTMLLEEGNRPVNTLHKEKSNLVRAEKQSQMADAMKEMLSQEEFEIYKRGRNAKTVSHAKNAGLSDYHKATGFECLIGYLYLQGNLDRILELIKAVL